MVISRTPVRVSLVGGGTDFPTYYQSKGGFVISTAINRYIYVIVKERFDNKIGAYYHTSEIVNNINDLKHNLIKWAAMACGLDKGGFDVSIMSDIPTDGSGLGSSSSLTVGLLNAFSTFVGEPRSLEFLASLACNIEIETLKKPIGIQDQYIAAYGGLRYLNFNSVQSDSTFGNVQTDLIKLSTENELNLESNLMLYYTGITRSSDTILKEQQSNIGSNTKELDDLKNIAQELFSELLDGNIDYVGEALNKSWLVKQKLASGISNTKIEEMWKKAMGAGALGAKIAGAGGGGFLLLYARKNVQDQIRKALKGHFEFPFLLEPRGSIILLNNPQRKIK